ncbi:MAG: carbohydrate-binding domain-containing protein [Oscillospiraceae bacterium]|nr:carbohydrate-binding domain-containing protein [Oscillospiraceae bacterium]
MKRFILPLLCCALLFSSCSLNRPSGQPPATPPGGTQGTPSGSTISTQPADLSVAIPSYNEEELSGRWDDSAYQIVFEDNTVTVSGKNASVSGSTVTLSAPGSYRLTGTHSNGQVVVNSAAQGTVQLILDGLSLTNTTGCPLYIQEADQVILTLAEGSQNTLTDAPEYILPEGETEPSATLFSHDDLTINGTGSLTVNANCNNGIQGKDDLKIVSGTITVNSVDDGIVGKDSLSIRDGQITVSAQGDGIKATNDSESDKGTLTIEGGNLQITAGNDGIQAEQVLLVSGGQITLSTGGGSQNSSTKNDDWGHWGDFPGANSSADTDTSSAKGLKATNTVAITGGTILADTSDDSLHANHSVLISGGALTLTSGDDGVHADTLLQITGGQITVTKSYEGLESAQIIIEDGRADITASDDGINIAGGNDSSAMGGRPGQNPFQSTGTDFLRISGGVICVDASGDGIDVNGYAEITGGTVVVNGPTNGGNGALDYDSSFTVSGGTFIAVGAAGMAQNVSNAENQGAVLFSLSVSAGELLRLEGADGIPILTFEGTKSYQTVVLSAPGLEVGKDYTVYTGGSCTGNRDACLYTGGQYTSGQKAGTFTLSSSVTGGSGGMGGGGMGGGMGGGGMGGGMGGRPR